MVDKEWRQALSALASKAGAAALFVYRLRPQSDLIPFAGYPDGVDSLSRISIDGVARGALAGSKPLFGEAKRFGGEFSRFPFPYLAVSGLRHRHKHLGILIAGAGKKISHEKLDLISSGSSHLSDKLAVQELEEENKELSAKAALLEKKLSAAYRRLLESDNLASLGRFAGGLAHELNTPLAAIQTYAEYLDLFSKAEADREPIDGIVKGVTHCKEIIENVLRLSREHKLTMEPVHMDGVVHDALLLTGPEMERRKIRVSCSLAPGMKPVAGDHTKLIQVLTNVLVNARDAVSRRRLIPRDGLIRISASGDGDFNTIEIADNGPGIPENILGKLFDPFFTTKEIGQGTGLGLSICHAIVEEHRGKMEILSAEGKGTTVLIRIPTLKEDISNGDPLNR